MKKILLSILIFSSFHTEAQITTRKLIGLDPITLQPGFIIKDTLRTIYYHSPLYTIGDTVYSSGGGQWSILNNNIFNTNSGKVGINDSVPVAQLQIVTPTNTTQLIDSTGLIISTPFAATSSLMKSAGPLIWEVMGWNTTTSTTQKERIRMGAFGAGGAGGGLPSFYLQTSKDSGNTYSNVFHTAGQQVIFDGAITGISAVFSQGVTAASFAQGTSSFISTNNFAAGGLGQLTVGSLPTYAYPEAIFQVFSNSQGIIPPTLTTTQRDSMGLQVASVTILSGGTGYTSAPTVAFPSSTANGLVNGASFASGTAVISGGSVTSVTITRPGTFIKNPGYVIFSGGGGSGASGYCVMVQVLHTGTTIYNSTNGRYEVWDGAKWQGLSGLTTGTAAPASTPTSVGQFYFDATNKKIYGSTGTSSSSDWTILN